MAGNRDEQELDLFSQPDLPEPGPSAPAAEEEQGPIAEITREVPGTNGRTITLTLERDHTIHVSRGPAWSGFHEAPAIQYEWEGGIPNPEDPKVPDTTLYAATKRVFSDPVAAMMEASARGHRLNREQKAEAQRIWADMWRELARHLDPRVASHAASYNYPAPLYRLLVQRKDLCDYIETCPALAPFYTLDRAQAVPEAGWDLRRVAEHFVSPDPEDRITLAPGFMVWAQKMDWKADRLPVFSRSKKDALVDMRSFVLRAARLGTSIDPNGIHKIESDDEWLLLHLALASDATSSLVPRILANPQAAQKQVEKYFPPNMKFIRGPEGMDVRLDRRTKASMVLEVAVQWAQAHPEEAARVDAFGGTIKRARAWDIRVRADETQQERELVEVMRERQRRIEAERAEAARLLEAERRRARRMFGYDPLPEDFDYKARFPHVPPEEFMSWRDDEFVIRILECGADLQREGTLAGHCVGGENYIAKCYHGDIYILTIRDRAADEAGRKPDNIYTVELVLPEWSIRQIQGKGNKFGYGHVLHRDEFNRLERWTRNALKEMRKNIQPWLEERARERVRSAMNAIGLDPDAEQAQEEAPQQDQPRGPVL